MGMIFTHGITYDTGAFTVRLIRTIVQFYHGIEDSALHRLQPIPYVRKRTGGYDAHCIIDKESLHSLFQVNFMNLVYYGLVIKNVVVHGYTSLCASAHIPIKI